MATSKLPLRVKVDVRDQFDASDCAVQKAFRTLEGIVGLKVSCNVEWDLLYNALETSFPDKTTFVPSIAQVIVAWCDVLSAKLEDDKFVTWTEEIVEKLEGAGAIKLRMQVSGSSRPSTTWSSEMSNFVLSFPSTGDTTVRIAASGFESDFQNLLNETPSKVPDNSQASRSNDDEWAEIDESGDSVSVSQANPPSVGIRSDRMPMVATLPTPDILLRTLKPYILHVTQHGSAKLVIQGTHGPSLSFLNEYLKRWIKKDHQDVRKIPLLRMTLHESHFGLGISYDALTIEPYDDRQNRRGIEVNPVIILTIIENVLGYQCLPQVNAGFWEFRRDIGFD